MPGLLGVIDTAGRLGHEAIRRAVDTMAAPLMHESTYTLQKFSTDKCSIALITNKAESGAPCPFESTGGKLFVAGEVFRIDDDDVLGESYRERLAKMLSENPANALDRVDGSFSLAFVNSRSGEIFIGSDMMSSRPVYYIWDDGVIYFAPEVKALLAAKPGLNEISEQGIADFLCHGTVVGDETYFTHIKNLRPLSLMKISAAGQMTIEQYHKVKFDDRARDEGEEEYIRELTRLIDRAVARATRDRDKKRINLSLSSGYDSRGILGALVRQNIKVATISHGDDRDKANSDAFIAKKICDKLGLENRFIRFNLDSLAEGSERAVYQSDGMVYQIANYTGNEYQEIAQEADVLLRGDEIFGWLGAPFNDDEALMLVGYIKFPHQYEPVLAPEKYHLFNQLARQGVRRLKDNCPQRELINRKEYYFITEVVPNIISRINYLKNIHVTIRDPFHDRTLVDFMSKLPPRYKPFKQLYIKSVRRACPQVFEFERGVANLPSWKSYYRDNAAMREFVRNTFLGSPNDFFDSIAGQGQIKKFLEDFSREVSSPKKATNPRSLKNRVIGKLEYEARSNYALYRAVQTFIKNKSVNLDWVENYHALIRLFVLRKWADLFISGKRF